MRRNGSINANYIMREYLLKKKYEKKKEIEKKKIGDKKMIPKIIHYCWFGGKGKPDTVKNCINSWKKYMKEYELKEWNEENFDINYNEFTKKAYENKKWAFVSDVARLWALYNYGGIYMDTDVLAFKSLDKFLNHSFFTGFENIHYPVTATMGAEKENVLVKEMLDIYDNKKFEVHKNWYDYETNTMIMSDIIGKYFNRDIMEYQERDNMAIYPRETFCSHEVLDENVYTQHLMLRFMGVEWNKKQYIYTIITYAK